MDRTRCSARRTIGCCAPLPSLGGAITGAATERQTLGRNCGTVAYNELMKVLSATVVDGRLDVPEGTLQDGQTVMLVVEDGEDSFSLTEEESAFLAESIAQIKRGESVDGWRLLDELPA